VKPHRVRALDGFLLLSVLLLAGYYLAAKVDPQAAPAEDAAMLMRYAKHLGEGHGIVWNIGEAPVDGATDFLFMAALGGLFSLGVSLEAGVRWLGFTAHFLTLIVVYFGALRMSGGRRWAAWLSAAFLAVGPGLRYSEAAFGTPFFAFFVALAWLLALYAVEWPGSTALSLGFGFASLLAGLTRPEGVLACAFMMLAVIIKLGIKQSRKILAVYLGIHLILGGAYFLWRWDYFGYPLPNPFYKKGGGLFYAHSLEQALRNTLDMSAPFWAAYLFGLALCLRPVLRLAAAPLRWLGRAESFAGRESRMVAAALRISLAAAVVIFLAALTRASSPLHPVLILGRYSPSYFAFLLALLATILAASAAERWLARRSAAEWTADRGRLEARASELAGMDVRAGVRGAFFLLLPAAGYVLMWGLLSDEMNILGRFQYALMPMMMMSWPGFFREIAAVWPESHIWKIHPPARAFAAMLLVLLGAFILQQQYGRYLLTYQRDGRMDAARMLHAYHDKGYSMAVTEAGLLPLYSEWRAVDTWGLNDSWIAHHGGVDAAYLGRYNPEVIMFHADFSPLSPPPDSAEAGSWLGMVLTLKQYAEANGYELAAVFGSSPRDTHYYYVRPGFPDSAAIIEDIRAIEAEGYIFGGRSINFINYQRREYDR
jgi:hypothetical protein